MSASRWVLVLFAALVLTPLAAPGSEPPPKLPDDVFAHPPGADAVDIVLFGTGRAAVLRAHIKVGDKPFRTAWGDFALRLHAFLDRDGNGTLTTDEANRAPWTNLLTNPLSGGQVIRPGMRPGSIDANPKDGFVTFNELASFLQETQNFGPLGAQAGAPPDPRAEAMFQQLDRDGDKVVTPAELSKTDTLIARLDSDEDETLSLDELTPDRSPLADRFRGANRGGTLLETAKGPAVPLTSAADRAMVATRLLAAWGQGTPPKIGPAPLGADPADFHAADANHDGRLDHVELMHYLQAPTAHLELAVTLATTPAGQGRIEKVGDQAHSLPTRTGPGGAIIVELAGSEIELSAVETRNNLVAFFENQFKNADADKDGAISSREASGFLRLIHDVADRNGDGLMTQSELKTYLDLSSAAEEARAVVTVSDQGVALYERLDANRDGRLSVRELRGAPAKMAGLDADHDGKFSLSELPRRTQLNLGRGLFLNRNRVVVATSAMNGPLRGRGDASSLPVWFAGMDRNRDGDVSPREFLGPPDQFRRFDADGDGLIDAGEAAKGP